jgi:hypothetical protein
VALPFKAQKMPPIMNTGTCGKNQLKIAHQLLKKSLKLHGSSMDMNLVRDYFRLFEKEDLLDEWLKRFD